MNHYTIHLTHGRGETDCEVDEYTVNDGALWLLAETGPRSSSRHLTPVLTLAAGTWWAIHPADLDPLDGVTAPAQPAERLQVLPAFSAEDD